MIAIATIQEPGTPARDLAGEARGSAKAAKAANVMLLLLVSVMVMLLAAWVLLTLVKHRWFAGAFITRKESRRRVKSPWKEAGRRLQVEPRSGNGDGPDGPGPDKPGPSPFPPAPPPSQPTPRA